MKHSITCICLLALITITPFKQAHAQAHTSNELGTCRLDITGTEQRTYNGTAFYDQQPGQFIISCQGQGERLWLTLYGLDTRPSRRTYAIGKAQALSVRARYRSSDRQQYIGRSGEVIITETGAGRIGGRFEVLVESSRGGVRHLSGRFVAQSTG